MHRITVLRYLAAFGFIVLVGRTAYMQLGMQESLQVASNARIVRTHTIDHARGRITDRDGDILAIDRISNRLYFDPQYQQILMDNLAEHKTLSRHQREARLARMMERLRAVEAMLGLPADSLQPGDQRSYVLADNIQPADYAKLRALNLKSIRLQSYYQRLYPARESFAHMVGYMQREQGSARKPLAGAERALDDQLRAVPGVQTTVHQRNRDIIDIAESTPGHAGGNIALTLDKRLQDYAYKALSEQAVRHQARDASAVMVEVATGKILAMVSWPSFNPNDYGARTPDKTRNRALLDRFEAGSTQKPILVAAALEEGLMDAAHTVDIPAVFTAPNIQPIYAENFQGKATLSDILANSINIGSAKIALETGAATLWRMQKKLRYGNDYDAYHAALGASALIHHEFWSTQDLVVQSYGYGVEINNLEALSFYQAMANDGVLMPPHLLVDTNVEGVPVVSVETAETMRGLLTDAVSLGTGRNASIACTNQTVAGKTGTTRYVRQGEVRYRALFIGFAPADAPKFALIVNINHPTADEYRYTGGEVAAPVFADIMAYTLRDAGMACET